MSWEDDNSKDPMADAAKQSAAAANERVKLDKEHLRVGIELAEHRDFMEEVRLRLQMEKDFGPLHLHGNGAFWPEWALRVARRMEWQ